MEQPLLNTDSGEFEPYFETEFGPTGAHYRTRSGWWMRAGPFCFVSWIVELETWQPGVSWELSVPPEGKLYVAGFPLPALSFGTGAVTRHSGFAGPDPRYTQLGCDVEVGAQRAAFRYSGPGKGVRQAQVSAISVAGNAWVRGFNVYLVG